MIQTRKTIKIQQDLPSSEEEDSTEHRVLQNKEISGLYDSYARMKSFCEFIPDNKPSEFGLAVEKYCSKSISFDLSAKNVVQIMDKRIERMLKNKRIKKNWSEEDTKILLWTFSHYCLQMQLTSVEEATSSDWKNISDLIPGSSADSCMFKILNLKKVKLADKKWTQIQENLLFQIVSDKKKKNWRSISQELYKAHDEENKIFRNAKQCKEHWMCYLNPELKKGPWDKQEDFNLMEHIFLNGGMKRWAEIAKIFRGRTQNALKNRFTLLIQRLRKQKPESNQLQLVQFFLEKIGMRQNSDRRSIGESKNVQRPKSEAKNLAETFETQNFPAPRGSENHLAQEPIHSQDTRNSLQGQCPVFYPTIHVLFWMMPDQCL